jgi:hypothetical protein
MLPDLDIELLPGMKDTHIWRLSSASGQHTAKSTYEGLFQGAILFRLWERIWKIRALRRCQKKSCGSLLIAGAGLLIDLLDMECHTLLAVLCDQEEETIHHLLCSCVFTQQFWLSTVSIYS